MRRVLLDLAMVILGVTLMVMFVIFAFMLAGVSAG